jgi:hypothetical protein
MKVDERTASWRFLLIVAASLMALHAVMHRLSTGTWRWDAEDWIPTLLGTVAGVLLARLGALALQRRQRTRNRPST